MSKPEDYSLALYNLIAKCYRQYGWRQGYIAKEIGMSESHLSALKHGRWSPKRCKTCWYALVGLIAVRKPDSIRSAR